MTPRRRTIALVAAAVMAFAVGAIAQVDRFAAVKMRAEQAGDGVVVLYGAGGNIGVWTGSDGVVLVDDQFAPLAPKVRAAVDSISGNKPIRFVFNTHWHGDHVGGNQALAEAGATIVAQDNVRRRMSTMQMSMMGDTVPPSPGKALPIITFPDSVTFHLNGQDVVCFHVAPAHTDGDAMVWFPTSNVLHCGDIFFNGRYPIIDLTNGGSYQGMIDASARALALIGPATRVIPGHGPLGDKATLQKYHDMLVAYRDRLKKQMSGGKTLDQVKSTHFAADLDSIWGKGGISPDRMVETAYKSLSRNKR